MVTFKGMHFSFALAATLPILNDKRLDDLIGVNATRPHDDLGFRSLYHAFLKTISAIDIARIHLNNLMQKTFNIPSYSDEILHINGLDYHIRHYGKKDAPVVFCLHGWMDTCATFTFLADMWGQQFHLVAPDWRGFGNSGRQHRTYWWVDYLCDLHLILQYYSPDVPALLVGHSMGASAAALYSGIYAERVKALVMLDFLGIPRRNDEEAPKRLRHWVDLVTQSPQRPTKKHDSLAALTKKLQSANPRLAEDKANYLAAQVSETYEDGSVSFACDGWHRETSPITLSIDEVLACWRLITAPVLSLIAAAGYVNQCFAHLPDELALRKACFSNAQFIDIANCGHNLHHDQASSVASLITEFFRPLLENHIKNN